MYVHIYLIILLFVYNIHMYKIYESYKYVFIV